MSSWCAAAPLSMCLVYCQEHRLAFEAHGRLSFAWGPCHGQPIHWTGENQPAPVHNGETGPYLQLDMHPLPDAMLGHFRQREGPPWGHAGAGATETGVWLRTSSSRVGFLVPSSLRQGVLGSHGATFKGPVELFTIASDTCGQPGCLCTTLTEGVL